MADSADPSDRYPMDESVRSFADEASFSFYERLRFAGSATILLHAAANRDPQQFACPADVAQIFDRFPRLRLAAGAEAPYFRGLYMRSMGPLHVALT